MVRKSRSIKSEYDGIKFDSRLEVYCYKALKEANITFEYTPTVYTLVPAFKFIGVSYEADKRTGKTLVPKSENLQSIKYTPDFVGKDWIIETKGAQTDVFNMRFKLFKKYLTDNKIETTLYMPKNHLQVDQVIKLILKKIEDDGI
jgi:hypothetical protein